MVPTKSDALVLFLSLDQMNAERQGGGVVGWGGACFVNISVRLRVRTCACVRWSGAGHRPFQ